MKLSDGVEAAIHCASSLAGLEPDETISAADLAHVYGLSSTYLVKHLMKLVSAGILQSIPGPKGGYRLARDAKDVTLKDIVFAVDGQSPAFRCKEIRRAGPKPLPSDAYPQICGINRAMLKAEKAYHEALAQTSLHDLVVEHETTSDDRVLARGCQLRDAMVRKQNTNRP